MRSRVGTMFTVGISAAVASLSLAALAGSGSAGNPKQDDPRAGQTYIGTQKFAACHFDQFTKWKKTKHAQAFDDLTAKYQADEKCLKCHTTGFGEATGFKDKATTSALAGVSCEQCHGPGSNHAEIAKPFAKVKKLSEEDDKKVRGSTWKILPKNVCVECHITQGHHDSLTPPEMRKTK